MSDNQPNPIIDLPTKKIVAIDSQILDNISACYYKWYLYNLQNWRPKQKSKAFDKGTLFHEIMRSYYQAKIDGQNWNNSVKIAMEHGDQKWPELTISVEDVQEVRKACIEYFTFYRGDLWRPIAVEETFSYKIYEDDDLIILYEGIVDLRVQTDVDENHPVDHKTTSRNDPVHPLKNQFIGYCRAHGVKRMTINRVGFQKTLKPAEKFTRHLKSYSTGVQEDWAKDTIHIIKMGIMHHEMGIFPKTGLASTCDGKFGACMFTEVCYSEPEAREMKLRIGFDQIAESWDPLARD